MIKRFLATLTLICLTIIGTPALASADFTPTSGVNCTGAAANSAVCTENTSGNTDPISGSDGIIIKIANIVTIIAGAAAIILIIVSGLKFVLAGGDSGAVNSARSTLINTFVGLIVIVLARALIGFIIDKV